MSKTFDVIGFGNALVDVLTQVDDDFLAAEKIEKGRMILVDKERAEHIHKKIVPVHSESGGSVANTTVVVASLGGKASYVGKVMDDDLGKIFTEDMWNHGVHYTTVPSNGPHPTGRCVSFVTKDAQRTFNTYLGACHALDAEDVDEDHISDAEIIYIEGYLWDLEAPRQAAVRAIDIAKQSDVKVAFNLSDSFCVDRYRGDFLGLVKDKIDILICNDSEIAALYQTNTYEDAMPQLLRDCKSGAVTLGSDGAILISANKAHRIKAMDVNEVVDTTGAGDAFAAGFLYGIARGIEIEDAGRWGAAAAAEIIKYYGPKPKQPLQKVVIGD
ncbi:MAG: adenosine kinase [Pseudomonadota bacterium]